MKKLSTYRNRKLFLVYNLKEVESTKEKIDYFENVVKVNFENAKLVLKYENENFGIYETDEGITHILMGKVGFEAGKSN